MRSITTDYNNSAYNSATKFTDVYSANGVTVPAKTPVNVRSMMDSVGAGDYVLSADTITIDHSTATVAHGSTGTSVITATISSAATAGIPIAVPIIIDAIDTNVILLAIVCCLPYSLSVLSILSNLTLSKV